MNECSVCMETAETIDCPTKKCTYQMCTQCKLKWYVDHRDCPACRVENGLYVGSSKLKESLKQFIVIISFYIVSLGVLLLLGRLVAYIFYTKTLKPFWCDADTFFILAMTGSVGVIASLLLLLLCSTACVFRWPRAFKRMVSASPRRHWSFSFFLSGLCSGCCCGRCCTRFFQTPYSFS